MPRRPNWWLRVASSGWQRPQMTVEQRELARRSRLLAWILLGLLAVNVVLLPIGIGDPATLVALLVSAAGIILAVALNRLGQVTPAGLLLVALICAAVIGDLASFPNGLSVDALPAYDLLVIPVVVAASVLPRAAAFGVAALNCALIALDFFLQPHAPDLAAEIAQYGGLTAGALALLARPFGIQIIIAVVAYLWVRGTDDAIRRADRAEEIAALEHSIAEQKRQLDVGIQLLLETHVHAANGDFSTRAPLRQDNVLWQISYSLNNLLARMQRAVQAEHQLTRTQEELRRLAAAIDDAQAGRQPLWPAPTGTAADLILERIARGQRRRSVPTAPYDQGQPVGFGQTPGGMGWPSLSSQPLGQSPFSQLPPSQPLGQSPYAPDQWQPRDRVDEGQQPPPANPWILPADQPEQPHP